MPADAFTWKDKLQSFFDGRAIEVMSKPSLDDLCYVSGRDPRLWGSAALRDDLGQSIVEQLGADGSATVLEVGCAAGFLAALVAPRVGRYDGIDLAAAPLEVARKLELPNAGFRQADGEALPFPDGTFDAAFCYDVFTNFPTFQDGEPLIAAMLRVVKPGGRVMIGSIPDSAESARFQRRVTEVGAELEAKFGPPPAAPATEEPAVEAVDGGWLARIGRLFGRGKAKPPAAAPAPVPVPAAPPEIICYEFAREDFRELGRRLGAETAIREIHALNPYHGFRFNAVFTRPL
ncbi:class I SAM-dependent methyltransferase [Bosea sp. (in: a-proteobacteria)]|uniref:class I SAM-dependent methyltransferase n=1 Tax=Bosea sp. (in: a-proteobacteria) TaxID=1871050 RepID=UPI002632325C|nr:class I SAM-dependent methyltransferase [Bosea sp. (in: a-proteobacteria)]MCO5090654.1 class I SAM-dependent methyltransferase [Bosea sp. (in: a-proteobacteria)]